MNHIFKVIFDRIKGLFVVVNEAKASRSKAHKATHVGGGCAH